jgi:LysR family hydrogen peroxide-inducible transcriptional activator
MNTQQLEYIIALNHTRHFAKAAQVCHVTQPTLSMMIQKLEEELGVKLFDRSRHPVEPTEIGRKIIEQSRSVLQQIEQIKEIVEGEKQVAQGRFRMGIIPTIASYLVPAMLEKHQKDYGDIELVLKETTTDLLLQAIIDGVLDGGILAGPLNRPEIVEYPVYYEKFYAYVSPLGELYKEKTIDLETIDINQLWLLENEHCLRGQIERLCRLKKGQSADAQPIRYESGSIETLIHVVDFNPGVTIIPEMHAMGLCEDKQENLRPLRNTTAVREVSLIVGTQFVRTTLLNRVLEIIRQSVPKSMQNPELKEFVIDL